MSSTDRAMDALDRAALVAEGKVAVPVIRAPVDDYLELAKLDPKALRDRLDRVVMGEDPEGGLDALLDGGALEALFPEVKAMSALATASGATRTCGSTRSRSSARPCRSSRFAGLRSSTTSAR